MSMMNVLAGVAVRELGPAVLWYSNLLGRRPDEQPMPGLAEYRFYRGGWMQIFEDAERAGRSSVTLTVDDLHATLATLDAKAIAYSKPVDTAYVETTILHDPDGNQVVLAQARSPANRAAA